MAGGWQSGDKDWFGPIAAALAARGLAAASIEYRTALESPFPACVEDTKAAVRWARAHAQAFNLDPGAIGAIGGSAGAHLAAYLGLTANIPQLEGDGGNNEQSSTIQAYVGMATVAHLQPNEHDATLNRFLGARSAHDSVWGFASPSAHVSQTSPPALLIHSASDPVVSVQQSIDLANRYAEANAPVELVIIPGAPHAFWNDEAYFDEMMDRSAQFFHRYLDSDRAQ